MNAHDVVRYERQITDAKNKFVDLLIEITKTAQSIPRPEPYDPGCEFPKFVKSRCNMLSEVLRDNCSRLIERVTGMDKELGIDISSRFSYKFSELCREKRNQSR